jgi:hypothetical protein
MKLILPITLTLACPAAFAQITPVGPFTGPHTEGFETQPAALGTLYRCLPGRIFNMTADICDPTTESLIIPGFWSLFCQATPHQGMRYAVGLAEALEVTFDAPVRGFGGYFATVGGQDGAVVTFFNGQTTVGTVNLTTNQCTYVWNGWTSTTLFTRVRIVGNSSFGDGGYVHMDDLEYLGSAQPCYANCDGSTVAPVLTANDFQCFLNKFAGGESYANCDGSTASPTLTANDFQCFLNRYAAGCS